MVRRAQLERLDRLVYRHSCGAWVLPAQHMRVAHSCTRCDELEPLTGERCYSTRDHDGEHTALVMGRWVTWSTSTSC